MEEDDGSWLYGLEDTEPEAVASIAEVFSQCNLTCCEYKPDFHVCTTDYNFSEFYNITEEPKYEMIIRWSFTIPVFLLGALGNLTIIHILLKNPLLLRTSVNNFILNMSVADLILAFCGPILFTIRDTNVFWVLGGSWCHLEGYIQEMVMLVSVSSLTIISFDRMIGVVFPFHQHIKQWQSCLVITSIWIVSGLLAIPFAVYRIYTERMWADVLETTCRETGDMVVWWSVSMIVLIWVPLTVMISCYTIIIIRFRKYDREVRGREHPYVTHTKKKVVKMMFVVVVVFVLCWGPLQVFTVSKKYFLDDNGSLLPNMETPYYTFLTISNYMVYLNPALNPIIYGHMHENFRIAFRTTYPCIFKNKPTMVLTRGTGNRGFVWTTRSTVLSSRTHSRTTPLEGPDPPPAPNSSQKPSPPPAPPDLPSSLDRFPAPLDSPKTPRASSVS